MLTLLHTVEESSDTLAFATEPVLASLANILGYLEDRLPQNLSANIREYNFLDFEIKYGLLQVRWLSDDGEMMPNACHSVLWKFQ